MSRHLNQDNGDQHSLSKSDAIPNHRRQLLTAGLATTLVGWTNSAHAADNALFQKNPLTNPVLEQLRIWEQAEADELKYGGELEAGDAKGTTPYAQLLVPILQMSDELKQVETLILQTTPNRRESLQQAQQILQQAKYEKIAFKKVFNAFGDNIYYTDPDRANMYLGGGATPKSSQSLAYLMRNDILTNLEDMRAELQYLLKSSTTTTTVDATEDVSQMAAAANKAMASYLAVVPPQEMEQARSLLSQSSSTSP